MSKEAIWKAFAETGEPVYYLLYKELRRNKLSEDGAGFFACSEAANRRNTLCISRFDNEATDEKDQPDCSTYFGAVPKAIDTEMKREKKQARVFSAG